jgi:cellobiose epimerase
LQAMSLTLYTFREEVKLELLRILNYWISHAVEKNGDGFYGVIDDKNIPDEKAPKAIVITGRILWTFSAAHQLFPDKRYPVIAKRAFEYLKNYFVDKEYGGVYWSVNNDGTPLQTKKQLYGHSFAIYGLSEYYKITKDEKVLQLAKNIFSKMIEYSYDKLNGGYTEAFERNWSDTNDYILSRAPNSKSMNTHLHLLEAYTNLYRVWKDEAAEFHLRHSIKMMLDHIINPETNRMILFFTKDWQPKTDIISYGHDIECSWLLVEAAEVLGDEEIIKKCKDISMKMSKAAADGLAEDGAINYEIEPDTGHLNDSKQWWPQAEAMVGFFNAYQLTGKVHFLEKSEKVWEFIKKYLMDKVNGEWCGGVDANHKIQSCDKVTFWKGPYHNSRSCMEIWRRMGKNG